MRTPATYAHSRQQLCWPIPSLFLLTLLLTTGCQNQRQELVESELRCKMQRIEELEKERAHLRGEVGQLEAELEAHQRKAAKSPQPTGATIIVKKITLGRLTGGYRKDPNVTHDDVLQVLLEPRDADGASVKAPGSAHIEVYEVTPQGLKAPLSTWDLSAGELRRMWDTPLFGGPAYRIELPWKSWPTTEQVKVIVRFTTLDGQMFEAEKLVDIRLPERRTRTQPTMIPTPPVGGDTLPMLPPSATTPPTMPGERPPLILPDCPPSPSQPPTSAPSSPMPEPMPQQISWRPVGSKPSQVTPVTFTPPVPPAAPTPLPPTEPTPKIRPRLLAPVGTQPAS
jgi:hypothetical protein